MRMQAVLYKNIIFINIFKNIFYLNNILYCLNTWKKIIILKKRVYTIEHYIYIYIYSKEREDFLP